MSLLGDSIFVSLIGLCLVWCCGTYKDATSYGIGAILGSTFDNCTYKRVIVMNVMFARWVIRYTSLNLRGENWL